MYWLYGAPSIFASETSRYAIQDSAVDVHDDGEHEYQEGSTGSPAKEREAGDVEDISGTLERTELSDQHADDQPQEVDTQQNDAQLSSRSKDVPVDKTKDNIIAARVSRTGLLFVTLTSTALTVWQTKPTVAVAAAVRSAKSVRSFGYNVDVLLRPDSSTVVVQTNRGYLIAYSLTTDPVAKIYKTQYPDYVGGHSRHRSFSGRPVRGEEDIVGPGEGTGVREVTLRLSTVIRLEAGISEVLALDNELLVATKDPAALQCIRWASDKSQPEMSVELIDDMPWLTDGSIILSMVYDRPMNISCWITEDGKAFAVQRKASGKGVEPSKQSFHGYNFHKPTEEGHYAVTAAINARFSLLAIGCSDGDVLVYTARDYAGSVPLSHRLTPPASRITTGALTVLSYSPDGYCLFAGFEHGWASWSVYGKPGGSSLGSDRGTSKANAEDWLLGVRDAFWIGGGSELVLVGQKSSRLWVLDVARSAVAGCFCPANTARSLLQTNTGFMVYRGYEMPDLSALATDQGLWHHVQIPSAYLAHQWPIRSAVISSDGRYVAIAGRRGLAHYSVQSGRWKTFEDPAVEYSFTVRGGMCWHQHVLIVAVETSESYEIRVYSREVSLDHSNIMHTEQLNAPIVLLSPSGVDSLLVYTYENQLIHYIISVSGSNVKLVQVGQITLNGIIRAPTRVRALSWILPKDQLENGDPSQDVATATVVFLVDGKLVFLQPTMKEGGELKYEMRIVAQNVEYYALMRDQQYFQLPEANPAKAQESSNGSAVPDPSLNDLRDSLWYFDGQVMKAWTDVQDILLPTSPEGSKENTASVSISIDFYPLSVLLNKGTLFGVESDIFQRRDISFAYLKFSTRTHLFIPPILRHHLAQSNTPSALYLSHAYQHLAYFPHALEVLLHDVLDDEVDNPPSPPATGLLPVVLSFLSSFPSYLDIVVQCTRKTEVRSWRTLFAHLPPPQTLFEEALDRGNLKTAGGYLLVLHTMEERDDAREREDQVVRLLRRAKDEGDWELCKELARFLIALDQTGEMLRGAVGKVGFGDRHGDGSRETLKANGKGKDVDRDYFNSPS